MTVLMTRVNWAINKVGWLEQWNNIIFSDERIWNFDCPDGSAYY